MAGFKEQITMQRQSVLLLLLAARTALGAPAGGLEFAKEAQRAFDRGAVHEAVNGWTKAVDHYRQEKNTNAQIQASVSLAAAWQAVGQHHRASDLLEDALELASISRNQPQLATVQSKLGAALVLTRQTERAAQLLNEALAAARERRDPALTASILNDQGTLHAALHEDPKALDLFKESAALARQSGNPLLGAQAMSNAAATAARLGDGAADSLNSQALQAIAPLPDGHHKSFLLLRAGQTDRDLKALDPAEASRLLKRAYQSFEQSLRMAENLGDLAMQTYALGYLAQLYERDGQRDAALALTRRAVSAAQQAQAPEAIYRWEWQLGRLLKARGESEQAIAAYRRAVQTLQPIRNDISLGYGNATVRSPFREAQGPLFFELADLLLDRATHPANQDRTQELLREARDTVEQLKAVELEDYFHDDCVNVQRAKTRAVEAVDQHTAVIYLIPLPDRTELLVGLVSGLKRWTVTVSAEQLTATVRQFRRHLETRTTYEYLEQAQQLYDWLIRPIRPTLTENGVTTLVFVPDGALRTIPLASLHDGDEFLVQSFAVAVAPGLSLVEPRPLEQGKVKLLLNGISKPVQGFPPLTFVSHELAEIQPLYRSDLLLDEGFTLADFRRKLNDEQYSIIHIASHGQFDRDVRKTFVLAYDGKLTLNDLEGLIRPSQYRGRPVELLVLSACQTAAGDDRAALGLAGVAVKAGARSALATLWFVNDQSTSALVSEIYSQLRNTPAVSKAHALQAAQIKLINDRRYRHPCYWSPYLIIGNWL